MTRQPAGLRAVLGQGLPARSTRKRFRLRTLKVGARVLGGTVLGRVGDARGGQGRSRGLLDPARRAAGRPRSTRSRSSTAGSCSRPPRSTGPKGLNVLYGDEESDGFSIGQILLLSKPLLEKRVLSDERIEIYEAGRDDIRSGQIDRRVLASLAYLAESGLRPTVTSLKAGHSLLHGLGQRVPPLLGQRRGHLGDQRRADPRPPGAGRRWPTRRCGALMRLQGTLAARPDHLAARARRCDHGDGRPRRPHPPRLPPLFDRRARQARGSRCLSPASGPTC